MSPRGGPRQPKGGPRVSGVGAASQRSDANQPVNVGRLSDAEDLTHGDMQKLREAVKRVPIGRATPPRLSAVAPPPSLPTGGAAASQELGEHIFSMPTNRPDEPDTAGSPYGPGAGPEVLTPPPAETEMDIVLRAMVELTGDASIAAMLEDHREFKSWKTQRSEAPQVASVPEVSEGSVEVEPEIEPTDFLEPVSPAEEGATEVPVDLEDPQVPAGTPEVEGGEDVGSSVVPPQVGGDAEMV